MSYDSILTVKESTVQMGAFNDRIYLMSLAENNGREIVNELIDMAVAEDLSKIFAKVPESCVLPFLSSGFEKEAVVPEMFPGDNGVFLSFLPLPLAEGAKYKKRA